MTLSQALLLTDDQLRVELAKALGWLNVRIIYRDGNFACGNPTVDDICRKTPDWPTSLDACRGLWAEIEKRDLEPQVLDALAVMIKRHDGMDMWRFVTATPRHPAPARDSGARGADGRGTCPSLSSPRGFGNSMDRDRAD